MIRLRYERMNKGLSMTALSYIVNISVGDISKLENGYLKPYPKWRKRFEAFFEIPCGKLFEEMNLNNELEGDHKCKDE